MHIYILDVFKYVYIYIYAAPSPRLWCLFVGIVFAYEVRKLKSSSVLNKYVLKGVHAHSNETKCYLKFEKELLFKQSEGRSSSDMPLFSTREVTEVQIGSSNVIATDTHQTVNLFPIELLLAKQLLSTFMRCFF